jgi:hypothetical protein
MPSSDPGKPILLIHSHYGTPPGLFEHAVARGEGIIVRERDLTRAHFDNAGGLITTSHLDQLGFLAWSDAVQAMLARGGRWFFNGHILRSFVPGLGIFQPIIRARRADLVLTRLTEHPIFDGIDQASFEENKGVAGFYGRGHNPLPAGAIAINGIGPDRLPIDWEWHVPGGGRIFSHAGNDIGGMGGVNPTHDLVAPRIIAWTKGELGA